MFKRKESLNFYALLIQQAQVIRDAVEALCAFCEDPTQEKGDFVKVKEKEADAIRRELVDDINRTFITPIDRDDLYRLSTSIDDLADYAWTTVKEIRIYDIAPDAHLLTMARTLLKMADGLLVCTQKLEKDHARFHACCAEAIDAYHGKNKKLVDNLTEELSALSATVIGSLDELKNKL